MAKLKFHDFFTPKWSTLRKNFMEAKVLEITQAIPLIFLRIFRDIFGFFQKWLHAKKWKKSPNNLKKFTSTVWVIRNTFFLSNFLSLSIEVYSCGSKILLRIISYSYCSFLWNCTRIISHTHKQSRARAYTHKHTLRTHTQNKLT